MRRVVRITETFEADVDRQLPAERWFSGVPSRSDFMMYELPHIIEVFATDFALLPRIRGAPPNVRRLVGRGNVVDLYFVAGHLTNDGVIELQLIEIDHRPIAG